MKIIAHRGNSEHFVENTIESIQSAISHQIYAIEIDVREVDGEFIVFHDANLHRLLGTDLDVETLSKGDFEQINNAQNKVIPTLNHVLDLVKNSTCLNIEIKQLSSIDKFCDLILCANRKYDAKIILSSFNHPLLQTLQHRLSHIELKHRFKFSLAMSHIPFNLSKYVEQLDFDIVAIDNEILTKDFIDEAHLLHLEVWAFTVDSVVTAKKLRAWDLDAIFCNDPFNMNKLLSSKH